MTGKVSRIGWAFDPLPVSGARRGGDPAEHVFRHELDTFVREVVQNANDQRVSEPRVDFTFSSLEGQPLKEFMEALRFDALRPHLLAAPRVRAHVEQLEKLKNLLVLRVADRNTVGLTGGEDDERSHFRALCKDVLVSHKNVESAGGSYGLGKSVLWAFSGLSTVAFNSVPQNSVHSPPRFIARTELPSHRVGDAEFAGPGWMGQLVTRGDRGERAESLWKLTANMVGRDLLIAREQLDTGTSILIVGFREPAADEPSTVAQLEPRMRAACQRWFWPAMNMEKRRLHLSVGDQSVEPSGPFVDAWRARNSHRIELDEPGDVLVRNLPLEIPAARDGSAALNAEVKLIVRLANEAETADVGSVACFRGAGMVVRYFDCRSIAAVGRPFHAVLAAGEGRQPEAPTLADKAVERFLRLAEPPGHDEWGATDAVKEAYQRGYKKAIDQLFDKVKATLRELLAPRSSSGARAPDRLLKRFPFGARGRPGGAPTSFHFSQLDGHRDGDRWVFEGAVSPSAPGGRWSVSVSMFALGDGNSRLDDVAAEGVEFLDGETRASVRVHDGRIVIDVPRGTESVRFRGRSVRLLTEQAMTALDVEITGTREALS